jgi:aminoglycoside phosphotransferase (APT) family kinase protein
VKGVPAHVSGPAPHGSMTPSGSRNAADDRALLATLTSHLTVHGSGWFPDLGDGEVAVELRSWSRRTTTDLLHFALGPPDVRRPEVIVKVPRQQPELGHRTGARSRPRVLPRTPPEERPAREFAELRRIEQLVRAAASPGIEAVRALDHLPASGAVVMERYDRPTLQQLFLRWVLGGRTTHAVVDAFAHAGAWLRLYHASTNPDADPVNETVEQLGAVVEQLAAYVSDRTADPQVAALLAAVTARVHALETHPAPLGPAHGDFGLPNLLVGSDGEVAALDTVGRWRAPTSQDVASLLTSTRTSKPFVLSRGRGIPGGRLARCERAFLDGYGAGDALDPELLRIHELAAHLDKWAYLLARDGAPGWARPATAWHRHQLQRYLAGRVQALLSAPSAGTRPTRTLPGARVRRAERQEGCTVALIGPDGAGKSTISRHLPVALGRPATTVYLGVNLAASDLMLPTTRLLRRLGRADGQRPAPATTAAVTNGAPGTDHRPGGGLRTSLRIGNLIAEEWYRWSVAAWHRRRGEVVVLDRHFLFDYYDRDVRPPPDTTLPVIRRLHGYLLREHYPRPDLTILLDAPATLLFARKGEGSVDELEARRQRYRELLDEVPRSAVVDASQPLASVLDEVVRLVRAVDAELRRSRGGAPYGLRPR